jgi:hypothetical protein
MAKANAKKAQGQQEGEVAEFDNGAEAAGNPAENPSDPAGTTSDEQVPADEQADAAESEGQSATVVTPEPVAPYVPLHARLEKAVRGAGASGNPDAVHALNKVEMLTGTLKLSLPAAIKAAGDEQLREDLEDLLSLL